MHPPLPKNDRARRYFPELPWWIGGTAVFFTWCVYCYITDVDWGSLLLGTASGAMIVCFSFDTSEDAANNSDWQDEDGV
ncbi:hypothetical protein [Brucella pseudogrignonensis]|uniref:Uncharacterized protein n=1 Tax=Brucella pseudogrignonensis TaxID=419475 RepID=A0A256GBJ0_9HYPH|nr:hypothetical protein [Brucella pseudogrignonensis]OYR23971.1 hypothetical protein CEV34_3304 [Brucella pseudogrignonensis]